MRIPPLLKLPGWQRLFSGIAIGAVLSWIIFLHIFGVFQEQQTKVIALQEDEIAELKKSLEIWQEEVNEMNLDKQKGLVIENVEVKLINSDKYKLDTFSIFEIEEMLKEDLAVLNAKEVETVFKNIPLIKKVVENKAIKITDKNYKLRVKEMIIFTKTIIHIEIYLAN